jgi:predicted membrane protein
MLRNRRERGEGQFGCLVGLVVVALAGLIAYRMIPIKVKAAELRDTIQDEARSAGQHNQKQIRRAILSKAEKLELPVEDENISIVRKSAEITIDVEYTVPVEFPGFTYEWDFHHHTENPIF